MSTMATRWSTTTNNPAHQVLAFEHLVRFLLYMFPRRSGCIITTATRLSSTTDCISLRLLCCFICFYYSVQRGAQPYTLTAEKPVFRPGYHALSTLFWLSVFGDGVGEFESHMKAGFSDATHTEAFSM
jgi:hypothetical protein